MQVTSLQPHKKSFQDFEITADLLAEVQEKSEEKGAFAVNPLLR